MNQTFVESLNIEEVTQTQLSSTMIEIRFKITGMKYRLALNKNSNGKYHPYSVAHGYFGMDSNDDFCHFCETQTPYCKELWAHMNELFERLITFSSIRLIWLYLEYEFF